MKTLARNHVTCSVWSSLCNNRTAFSVRGPCGDYITRITSAPCGGGVEYLHRDPASRKRRRNGKSQI
jgi:hypothetical protein